MAEVNPEKVVSEEIDISSIKLEDQTPGAPEEQPPAEEPGEVEEEIAADETTDEPPATGEDVEEKTAELQRKAEKAKADAEYWTREKRKRRAEYFKGDEPPPQPAQAEELPAQAPKEADFETYEQYQDALIEYKAGLKVDQKIAEYRTKEKTQSEQLELAQFMQGVIQDGGGKYDDFVDKCTIEGAPNLPLTEEMLTIIKESENPVDVIYYLGNNVNVCASIARMNTSAKVRELTKIDLEAGKAAEPKEKKPVTEAPPPIKPAKSANVVATKNLEDMTQAELEEEWKRRGNRI
jgi:hypothetical protein